MGKNYGYNKWTEQEEDFVLENAKAFDGTFTHDEILRGLKHLTGVERNKKSIQHKISRLLAKYGLHNPQKINFKSLKKTSVKESLIKILSSANQSNKS